MIEAFAAATFWGGLGLTLYVYAGYPAIVWALGRVRPRPVQRRPVTPTITVLIAARNEAMRIEERIANCLSLEYPTDRLDVVVVSDGSTDRTTEIVGKCIRRFPGRVSLVPLRDGIGKAGALSAGAAQASGEILLLADARQTFAPEVAQALAENFADGEVGAVSGELHLVGDDDGRGAGLGLYWRYEKGIRRAESLVGSSMGYTGAVSAIRRSLFQPLPTDTILDDLVHPLRLISQGHRVVFEAGARAFDRLSTDGGHEFGRKVRTLAGVLQTCVEIRRLVGPLPAGTWWQLLSHKALRLAVPYSLIAVLVASALLDGPVYRLALFGQVLIYGLGLVGLAWDRGGRLGRVVRLPATFLMLNAAAVVGVVRYLTGRRLDLWKPAGIASAGPSAPRSETGMSSGGIEGRAT
jgi:cellulose synthase/poly-beta-1,6-N-acetylglucosamine synthase-like glycosyltransferase